MIKQVTEIDSEFLNRLDSTMQEIKRGLQNIRAIPQNDYLTADEYMAKIKVSRWKFDALIKEGLLEYKKVGRKFYIPLNQVTKYFNGEMNLPG